VRKTGEEFAKLAPELEGTQVEAKVGLIRSFDTLWALDQQPGASNFRYDEHCFQSYRAVKQHGYSCDILNTDSDFTKYVVVLAPSLTIVDPPLAEKLADYVNAGGTVVFSPQSGARTGTNKMNDKTRPGLLAELCGMTVEEVRPYHHGQTSEIAFVAEALSGQTCTAGLWVEILQAATATPIAEYRDEAFAGKPAITVNTVGKGKAYYMGAYLPPANLKAFLGTILPDFPIKNIPDGIEITQRKGNQKRFVFVINNSGQRQELTLPAPMRDLLSGENVGPKDTIAKNGVLILKV
jgi:beta-galactosidase